MYFGTVEVVGEVGAGAENDARAEELEQAPGDEDEFAALHFARRVIRVGDAGISDLPERSAIR